MEYEITDYGAGQNLPQWEKNRASCGALKRKLGASYVGRVPLVAAAAVRADAGAPPQVRLLAAHRAPALPPFPQCAPPFMNNMDEITFWVYTKQAPCLMNFDNQIKKQYESAQSSKDLKGERSVLDAVPSPKKKKRKLSLLDDECVSSEKQQNVYFAPSQQKQKTVLSSCKSETLESDIDFNIKKSSIQDNPKRIKLQKNGRTVHKKNKVVTSTPLRRSLRKVQNGFNVSGLSNTVDIHNGTNGDVTDSKQDSKQSQKPKKSPRKLQNTDTSEDKKNDSKKPANETVQNGKFEDLSDVSGFTANYIRSTKVHSSSKQSRNLRNKSSRNLVKASQQSLQKNSSTMIVCVNKAVNTTTDPPQCSILNCSTDSSQNVINLITTNKNNDKSTKINRSTSLLRFVDPKCPKTKVSSGTKVLSKTEMDTSFQSQTTSNSRYPKRQKNLSRDVTVSSSGPNYLTRISSEGRKKRNKNARDVNCSDRKENPTGKSLSRTRSGSNSALALRYQENSVLVYSNSTEVSTVNVMNVASPRTRHKGKRLSSQKQKKSMDQSGPLYKDSVREKSGFSACFSESEDDTEALQQRKFFC